MRFKAPIVSTAVAMLSGLAVLLLLLLPTGLDALYAGVIRWAAALAAVALLVGLVNLVNVHVEKSSGGGSEAVSSIALLAAFGLTFLAALFLGPNGSAAGVEPVNWLFQYVQVPVEAALMALLAVSLVYASARLLRRVPNLFSFVFIGTALLVLLGTSTLATGEFGLISELVTGVHGWITRVPAAAGARGLLIGVALGSVAAGLRILIGTDRPFGG
ncbi:MAG TPA: hypothetical protein VMN57_10970 [Anaerolineales bacterium]|nr:hypothetical protein [Anaerolineales bacterium]